MKHVVSQYYLECWSCKEKSAHTRRCNGFLLAFEYGQRFIEATGWAIIIIHFPFVRNLERRAPFGVSVITHN
jgi:hypothetical protein